MPKKVTTKITCDSCGQDVDRNERVMPSSYLSYHLELRSHDITSMVGHNADYPNMPTGLDCYFCSLVCLSNWIKSKECL